MAKNVLLQMKLNGVVEQILPRTIADLVMVADNETLSQRLETIGGGIDSLITPAQVDAKIAEAVKDMATDGELEAAVKAITDVYATDEEVAAAIKEVTDVMASDAEVAAAIEPLAVKTQVAADIATATSDMATKTQVAADIAAATADMATNAAVSQAVSDAVDALIDGAPGTYDTLKEIADYIAQDGQAAAAMTELIATKVDKVEGMGLSANDFTNALLAKLNAISEGANKVEASETNGNIKVDGAEVTVYTHPAVNHIPAGGAADQHLVWNAAGEAKWEDMPEYILSGSEAPADLEEGQLFVQLL